MAEIEFREETHQYFNNKNGHEYISGTTFLHLFEPKFNENGEISKRVANKKGVSEEEILNEWKESGRVACEYGTKIHKVMEDYVRFGDVDVIYDSLYTSFDKIVNPLRKSCKNIFCEELLFLHEAEIAGTADLIIDHDDKEFSILDFKTNKKIDFSSSFGNRMLRPLAHLSQCNYNLYSLQLSLYAYLYSIKTGKEVRQLGLIYKNGTNWTLIPCNYMLYEIKVMIKYYLRYIKK